MSIKPVFENNFLPIVFSSDENYILYVGVAIQSLLESSKGKDINYDIVIFGSNISERRKNLILKLQQSNLSIRIFDIDRYINSGESNYKNIFESCGYWSASTYHRIFIPKLMKDYERVLYLDCDILIKDDLSELITFNFDGFPMATVKDMPCIFIQEDIKRKSFLNEKLGIFDYDKYFNAGVMLFNNKVIDDEEFINSFIKKLNEIGKPKYPDQDALNSLYSNNTKRLDVVWNYQQGTFFDREPKYAEEFDVNPDDVKIVHFISTRKPWNTPDMEYADLWWKSARKTDFYEEIIFKNIVPATDLVNYKKYKFKAFIYNMMSKVTNGRTKDKYLNKVKLLNRKLKRIS